MRRQRRETRRERQQREHADRLVFNLEQSIQRRLTEQEHREAMAKRQFAKMLNLGNSYGISASQFMRRSGPQLTKDLLNKWSRSWPSLQKALHKEEPDPGPVLVEVDYAALELRLLAYAKGDAEFTSKLFQAVYPGGLDEQAQEATVQEEPTALGRQDANSKGKGLGAAH